MKKIFIVSLALSLCATILAPSFADASFLDVDATTPNQKAIEWLEKNNITPPDKTKFLPDKFITKGELYELAWRAAGYIPTATESAATSTPFTDLQPSSRFAPYAQRAVDTGLLQAGGRFTPGLQMRRADTLKTLFDIMGVGVTRVYTKDDLSFSDVTPTSRYAPIAKTALEFGIMSGEPAFRPRQKVTRAEVAEYIYKMTTLVPVQTINITSGSDSFDPNNTFASNEKFKILMDVWDKIHQKFVGKNPVDDNELLYGAIGGMVNKLGDKYTVFQEPANAKSFSDSLSGEFDGIGISIDQIDNAIKIVSPLQGTPASKGGLKANDTILQVNGMSVDGLSLSEVSGLVKGPTGTSVTLLIERNGQKMDFSIVREHIKLDTVTGEMKGNTAYIIIRTFTDTSGSEFTAMAKKLLANNPTSFVIDLRDNPGGYLDASLQMLDMFVPEKTRLASIKFLTRKNAEDFFSGSSGTPGREQLDSANPEVIFYSIGNGELSKLPIKVLINGGSASASEIMAASLKENFRATLIGEKSFGKGTVQEITDYIDGSLYKETIGKWQTPRGNNLTENPIAPDITVIDDPKTLNDEILDYALSH